MTLQNNSKATSAARGHDFIMHLLTTGKLHPQAIANNKARKLKRQQHLQKKAERDK